MRTLFTTTTTDEPDATAVDYALEDLAIALRREFPAYYVAETVKTDFVAAIVLESMIDNAPIPAHLNGWGTGSLTLKLVA